MSGNGALVLFSGGQDSATCLAWALRRFARVETVGFAYGQRHRVELDCARAFRARLPALLPAWADRLGEAHVLPIEALGTLSDTALTRDAEIALRHIVAGMCETDYSGYPDCRDDAVKAMQVALNLGMRQRFVVHTPLMWRDKAATWRLAEEIGGAALVEAIADETHSCYLGVRAHRHPWGVGCGACPACDLRRRGWEAYRGGAGA
jgi:7-cyano-7-deazaguanine synthase